MTRITNFYRLAVLLLPVRLRLPRMIAFCKVLVTQLYTVQRLFLEYKEDTLYKMNHNGQVCFLQGALNDAFDRTLRRIVVTDQERTDFLVIYQRSEMKEVRLGCVEVYPRGTAMSDQIDFVIKVPEELRSVDNEARLKAIVNYYKLAGKQYTINYE